MQDGEGRLTDGSGRLPMRPALAGTEPRTHQVALLSLHPSTTAARARRSSYILASLHQEYRIMSIVPNASGSECAPASEAPAQQTPSPNAANGAEPADQEPEGARPQKPAGQNGHDALGRFARGNAGGPGNPFGRKIAAL